MQSNKVEAVEISQELLDLVEAVPDVAPKSVPLSPEADAVILKYYHKKNKRQLAKVLGIGRDRLRERYQELVKDQA